jgi:uncharacterized RDD family membrane protein YckC
VSEQPPTATEYAGLVTRAAGLLIDAVVIDVIALLLGGAVNLVLSVFGISGHINLVAAVAGGLAWLVWSGVYFVTFWTVTGQTPGDRLMGIRVVAPDGRIGTVRAVRRFGGLLLSTLPLGAGFVPILFDDQRRGLHDRIAGTVVRWDEPPGDAVTPPPALTRPEASRSV